MHKYKVFTTRQYMEKKRFEIFKYRDTYLHEVALHHHDFYEFYLFLSGDVTYSIESRSYSLRAGDLLIISPSELHRPIISQANVPYERIVLWVEPALFESFSTEEADLARCFDTLSPDHSNLIRPLDKGRSAITSMMTSLLDESESNSFGADCACLAILLSLIIYVNRISKQGIAQTAPFDKSELLIGEVLKHINEHYQDDLALDSLASRFFISKYHLSHEFNRLVGTSVYRYIIQKRLIIAKQLLNDGVPPTTAYYECGFGDYANFYRSFKAEYKISPKEFAVARLL